MSRKVLCYGPFCYPKRIKHLKSNLIKYGRKHYCHKCWRFIKKRNFYRHQLYEYIKDKAHISYPDGIMLRDIKTLIKGRHYTYDGILNGLRYANKFSVNFNFDGSFFIRYVPFVYEKAQKYVYQQSIQNNLSLNPTEINNNIKRASVNSKVFEPKKKKHYFNMNNY